MNTSRNRDLCDLSDKTEESVVKKHAFYLPAEETITATHTKTSISISVIFVCNQKKEKSGLKYLSK